MQQLIEGLIQGCYMLLEGPQLTLRIARQFLDAIVADADPEVLGGHLFQVVRLVENDGVVTWDHFAVGGFFKGEVGEEEVMVDDDDIGRRRLLAHTRDETAVVPLTTLAQAGLAGSAEFTPDKRIVRQVS